MFPLTQIRQQQTKWLLLNTNSSQTELLEFTWCQQPDRTCPLAVSNERTWGAEHRVHFSKLAESPRGQGEVEVGTCFMPEGACYVWCSVPS